MARTETECPPPPSHRLQRPSVTDVALQQGAAEDIAGFGSCARSRSRLRMICSDSLITVDHICKQKPGKCLTFFNFSWAALDRLRRSYSNHRRTAAQTKGFKPHFCGRKVVRGWAGNHNRQYDMRGLPSGSKHALSCRLEVCSRAMKIFGTNFCGLRSDQPGTTCSAPAP